MYRITPQVTKLYNALMDRGIKCKLEDNDGHKTVDISISWAMIDIEVDGNQHFTDPEQIKADFRRSYYSIMEKDFDTLHIPNIIIESNLEQVADAIAIVARSHHKAIVEDLKEQQKSIWNKIKKIFLN